MACSTATAEFAWTKHRTRAPPNIREGQLPRVGGNDRFSAPKQTPDGLTQQLAFEVPNGDVDTGECHHHLRFRAAGEVRLSAARMEARSLARTRALKKLVVEGLRFQ